MSILAIAGAALTLAAPQAPSGPALLAKHAANLNAARSLTVSFSVTHFPAAPEDYKLTYGRSGTLRIETPRQIVVTDGKTVWEYDRASNEYVEQPGDAKTLLDTVKKDEFLAWAAFFIPDMFKNVKDAVAEKSKTIKGKTVTPVNFTIDASKSKTATVYIDGELGVARGMSVKAARSGDSSETLVMAKEIKVSESEADGSTFAFQIPAGAKKVELSSKDMEKWYATVDEGIAAAKASNRLVFLDFGAEW